MRWDLQDGLQLARALQPIAKLHGYHVTLGGSVLNKGVSEKDIDFYFLPRNAFPDSKETPDPNALRKALEDLWGRSVDIKSYSEQDAEPYTLRTKKRSSLYNQDFIAVNRAFNAEQEYAINSSKMFDYPPPDSLSADPKYLFKHAITFMRDSGDRIDCFIL